MKHVTPPRWLEFVLRGLLSERDRETVAGDLHEEFRDHKISQLGSFRADIWYAWQVLSFAPQRFLSAFAQPRVLPLICSLTGVAGMWLGGNGLFRHHPVYTRGELIALAIVVQSILTLISLHTRKLAFMKFLALAGCSVITWLGFTAILAAFRGSPLEGYVLLIALLLLIQSVLTIGTLFSGGRGTRLKA